jgi:hypothetical protein
LILGLGTSRVGKRVSGHVTQGRKRDPFTFRSAYSSSPGGYVRRVLKGVSKRAERDRCTRVDVDSAASATF